MNRFDFQRLAELRVKEAEVLLGQGYFDGAYYLLGYAVECAFKACIARQTKQYDFPPERKAIEAIYQHDPIKLLKASGLEGDHEIEMQANSTFADNWKIVQVWSEQLRYQIGKSEAEVKDFYTAVVSDEGVLSWVKKYW
ncbi:MAG: DNA-binding protein [Candidatus Aminicenantes bacterium]|nr:DNA-binding protein [Candidatus Aminicenantes bacterium]